MNTLPEESLLLKQWEKPSLTVLSASETQGGVGLPGADCFGQSS